MEVELSSWSWYPRRLRAEACRGTDLLSGLHDPPSCWKNKHQRKIRKVLRRRERVVKDNSFGKKTWKYMFQGAVCGLYVCTKTSCSYRTDVPTLDLTLRNTGEPWGSAEGGRCLSNEAVALDMAVGIFVNGERGDWHWNGMRTWRPVGEHQNERQDDTITNAFNKLHRGHQTHAQWETNKNWASVFGGWSTAIFRPGFMMWSGPQQHKTPNPN